MATVLLGWEVGDGLGHVGPLMALARALRARGHRPVLVASKLEFAVIAAGDDDLPILQTPAARVRPPERVKSSGFTAWSDLLLMIGYDTPDRLYPLVRGWADTIAMVRPDLLVTDFAPTAIVANAGRLPAMALGWGYTMPPRTLSATPSMHGQERAVPDEAIFETVAAVQRRAGLPVHAGRLLDAVVPEHGYVITLPELDYFEHRRDRPAIGPIQPLPSPRPADGTADYFAYLSHANAATESVLEALVRSGLSGTVYLRDARPETVDGWRDRGLAVSDQPLDFAEAAGRARLVLHHGGLRTMEAALALGRPQVLVPAHIEHLMNAQRLRRLGTAEVWDGPTLAKAEALPDRLRRFLADGRVRARAAAIPATLSLVDDRANLSRLADICETLIGGA
jgi:rhamnosyltransferase subunit B